MTPPLHSRVGPLGFSTGMPRSSRGDISSPPTNTVGRVAALPLPMKLHFHFLEQQNLPYPVFPIEQFVRRHFPTISDHTKHTPSYQMRLRVNLWLPQLFLQDKPCILSHQPLKSVPESQDKGHKQRVQKWFAWHSARARQESRVRNKIPTASSLSFLGLSKFLPLRTGHVICNCQGEENL